MNVRGRKVRLLKRLEVREVSPVLQGAGIGVTTLDAKELDAATRAELQAIAHQLDPGPDMAREYARFVRSTMEAA